MGGGVGGGEGDLISTTSALLTILVITMFYRNSSI